MKLTVRQVEEMVDYIDQYLNNKDVKKPINRLRLQRIMGGLYPKLDALNREIITNKCLNRGIAEVRYDREGIHRTG